MELVQGRVYRLFSILLVMSSFTMILDHRSSTRGPPMYFVWLEYICLIVTVSLYYKLFLFIIRRPANWLRKVTVPLSLWLRARTEELLFILNTLRAVF